MPSGTTRSVEFRILPNSGSCCASTIPCVLDWQWLTCRWQAFVGRGGLLEDRVDRNPKPGQGGLFEPERNSSIGFLPWQPEGIQRRKHVARPPALKSGLAGYRSEFAARINSSVAQMFAD